MCWNWDGDEWAGPGTLPREAQVLAISSMKTNKHIHGPELPFQPQHRHSLHKHFSVVAFPPRINILKKQISQSSESCCDSNEPVQAPPWEEFPEPSTEDFQCSQSCVFPKWTIYIVENHWAAACGFQAIINKRKWCPHLKIPHCPRVRFLGVMG